MTWCIHGKLKYFAVMSHDFEPLTSMDFRRGTSIHAINAAWQLRTDVSTFIHQRDLRLEPCKQFEALGEAVVDVGQLCLQTRPKRTANPQDWIGYLLIVLNIVCHAMMFFYYKYFGSVFIIVFTGFGN